MPRDEHSALRDGILRECGLYPPVVPLSAPDAAMRLLACARVASVDNREVYYAPAAGLASMVTVAPIKGERDAVAVSPRNETAACALVLELLSEAGAAAAAVLPAARALCDAALAPPTPTPRPPPPRPQTMPAWATPWSPGSAVAPEPPPRPPRRLGRHLDRPRALPRHGPRRRPPPSTSPPAPTPSASPPARYGLSRSPSTIQDRAGKPTAPSPRSERTPSPRCGWCARTPSATRPRGRLSSKPYPSAPTRTGTVSGPRPCRGPWTPSTRSWEGRSCTRTRRRRGIRSGGNTRRSSPRCPITCPKCFRASCTRRRISARRPRRGTRTE